ncbi:MAG: SirA family protein [Caulobacteraceae bacterium]|nr:MAG: SirA family protein [Caulobacteraceae bacterium]
MSDVPTLDARGHRCPVPTLKLRKALAGMEIGALVRLIADDPMAKVDVPHFASQGGHELVEQAEAAGAVSFLIRKGQPFAS